MTLLFVGISLYLTYRTGLMALEEWKNGNRTAVLFLFLLAASLLPLGVLASR